MARLPGGLNPLRGWWLLRSRTVIVACGVLCAVVAFALLTDQWEGVLTVAVVVLAVNGVSWLIGRRSPAGAPVTAERQPDLYTLVRDTAATLGVPVPDRVWLGHEGDVIGLIKQGRRELVIGLPAAYALPRAELVALVAHELAVLHTPDGSRLALLLHQRWARAVDELSDLEEGEQPPPRMVRPIRKLEPIGVAVERHADSRVPDARIAASALIHGHWLDADFSAFGMLTQFQLRKRVGGRRYRIEDLHDGWRRKVAARECSFAGAPIDTGDAAMVARRHPDLATAARALVGQPMRPGLAADPVPVADLTRRERRRLAHRVAGDPREDAWRRWRTFQTAPPEIWRRDAGYDARQVRRAVAKVVGHAPRDAAEAAEVIRTRPVDVALAPVNKHQADDQMWSAADVDPDRARAFDWCDLLEDVLLGAGWLRVDPAVPAVLRDAAGTVLDCADLTTRAATDPFAYADLCRLLSTPPPGRMIRGQVAA